MRIVDSYGRDLGPATASIVDDIIKNIDREDVASAVAEKIKEHFQQKYPGSKHYSPSKVNVEQGDNENYDVNVDVPGVSRAYHDIDIYPINKQWLCIPLEAARGQSPYDIEGLFKPKGHNVLMKEVGGMLTPFFALSKHVHQNQDSTLMPTDDELFDAIVQQILNNF